MEPGAASGMFGREERKALRRERIALGVIRDGQGDKAAAGTGGAVVGMGQQAAADALAHLDKKKAAGIDAATAVRVAAEDREAQRRVMEEKMRQERLQRLQEEAVRSGRHNAAIEMRWAELLEQNMPQELHDEVEAQKAACARVVAGKDALVAAFQAQLKAKDEEYIKGLKQQSQDVDRLLQHMHVETSELREAYEADLEAVDEAFLQEREDVLAANKAETDALFERRRESDLAQMERKQKLQERQTRELEDMLTRDAEEYSKLKVKLESDVAALEQQLEEMRATYQLNTEKLEYNYRVLTERDMENSATLAHQKRRLTKLKDALCGLLQRYQETDTRDRRRNEDLTEEYRRITRQYRDLQAKFRHFEVSDKERYDQIFAMHREEVLAGVQRVLHADQVIHAQLLGWDWRPPNLELFLLPSEREGALAATNARAAATQRSGSAVEVTPEAVPRSPDGQSDTTNTASGSPQLHVAQAAPESTHKVSGARMKVVLTLLAQEARFLVDHNVRKALDGMPEGEASLAAAENALSVLGVRSGRDMEALVSYFFALEDPDVDSDEPLPHADFASLGLGSGDEPDALRALLTAIRPDDVVRAIRAFVEDRAASCDAASASSMVAGGGGAAAAVALGGRSGGGVEAARVQRQRDRVLRRREEQAWERPAEALGEQGALVWERLERGLIRYSDLLSERARRLAAVDGLRDQNLKLKAVLRQYLGSSVNQDLIVPPAQTIQVARAF